MLNTLLKSSLWVVLVVYSAAPSYASSNTVVGRVMAFSATSISVLQGEVITVGLTERTVFTKMVTQKPWEEDTRLSRGALAVGQYVAVHRDKRDFDRAGWVQVATDMRPTTFVTSLMDPGVAQMHDHQHKAPKPNESASDKPLSADDARLLVVTAKTRADHLALAKYFEAEASRYDAQAAEHAQMAKAYRARPTASETKRPGSPDTSSHCDRLAEFAQKSAATSRELAAAQRAIAENLR